MRKYLIIGITFLLVTLPGAFDAWLSLIERFSGEDVSLLPIPTSVWYQSLFPIMGFAVLIFGIWWTRDKDKEKVEGSTSSSSVDVSEPRTSISDTHSEITNEGPDGVPQPVSDGSTQAFPPTLLDASAFDLIGIFKGRTTTQAKPLVDAQIGNMAQIKGNIYDIDESLRGGYTVSIYEPSDSYLSETLVLAYFDEEWTEVIRSLSVDQRVSVLGQIDDISRSSIRLVSCSLVKELDA